MNLAGVIILYHPDFDVVIRNIKNYIDDLDFLIVWDNTPLKNNQDQINVLLSDYNKKILYQTEYENKGIAYALNKAFEIARQKEFDFILTMDQDSIWEKFREYKIEITNNIHSSIAIYAPLIVNVANNKIIRCNNSNFVITSGAIYNITLFQKIGNFRENYFIDEVDNEYCLRTIKNGFKIRIIENSFLYQTFGSPVESKGFEKYTAHYSAFRTYYQIRNRMWVWREYSSQLSYNYLLRTILLSGLRRFFLIILYEKCKKEKLFTIIKAFKDGLFKTYKLNE